MQQLALAGGTILLVFDGLVVETFRDGYDKSVRTPAAWVGVSTRAKRHERIGCTIGRAKDRAGGPVYGPDLDLSWTDAVFDLEAGEEPALRAFFTAVAQAAGRPGTV